MPSHEIALPAGSKNLSPALPTITRHSKDGDIPVIRLFAGDNFIGDVLEGQWLKGEDGTIQGPFTAILNGGQLELTGKTAVAADYDFGWVNGQDPFLMMQDAYVDVHMKVPSATPTNTVILSFILVSEATTGYPFSNNIVTVALARTSTPIYRIHVRKRINGSWTTIYNYATVTNQEGTFRIKFRPDDDKLDVYYHDGAGDVNESSDELTLTNDTLDLAFSIGYPSLTIETSDTTLYTVISEKVEVSYPDLDVKYDLSDEAFQGESSELLTKAFDTSGNIKDGTIIKATWKRDGKYGKALHFDGIDDSVDIPSTTYDLSSTTFTFWAKRAVLRANFPSVSMAIFADGTTVNRFLFFVGGSGYIQLETNTNADVATGTFTDDVDVWHHYAVVCNNYAVTFYEDGIDVTVEGVITDDVTFSQIGQAASDREYQGLIDEIRIYDTVLSQADIQNMMVGTLPSSGLIREYLFDGGNTRGDVVCYDTRGETDETLWQRVYTKDHEFSGNCVIENGLIRLLINEGGSRGLEMYYWDGSTWTRPFNEPYYYLGTPITVLRYPVSRPIKEMNRSESIQIPVRMCDTAIDDGDYHTDILITMRRGDYHIIVKIEATYPSQTARFISSHTTPDIRWQYCGDAMTEEIGDHDLSVTVDNTTLTDNFMLLFDDEGSKALGFIATNEKPAGWSYAFIGSGGYISIATIAIADFDTTEMYWGIIPFRKIANLFIEAEDTTLSGGVTVNHFEDGFGADSSGEYEKDTGSFTWDTGNSRLTSTANAKQILVKALEFGSGTYEFVWTHILGPGSPIGGLIFCSDGEAATQGNTPKNGYFVGMNADAGQITLERWLNDSMQQLDAEWFTFTVDVPYKITVVFDSVADTITVDIDDVQKMSTSSATHFNSGAFGIGNNGECYYDSVDIDAEEVESSGNSAVMLDVNTEYLKWMTTDALNTLPIGRYLVIFRAKCTNPIADDVRSAVFNETDTRHLHEEREDIYREITTSYAYYTMVFELTEDDDGDTVRLCWVYKQQTNPSTIAVDYFLIIPIGDGESFPQDIAHSALRSLTKNPKLVER